VKRSGDADAAFADSTSLGGSVAVSGFQAGVGRVIKSVLGAQALYDFAYTKVMSPEPQQLDRLRCNMAVANINSLSQVASYAIRPTLVEARLITDKHEADAVYVATLAEELRRIEAKIAAMEEAKQFGLSVVAIRSGPLLAADHSPDANWIRTKSRELVARLRRVEQSSI